MSEKTRATWPKVVIAVPLLLIILYVLLADSVIKSTLESQLGNAHGAEVNIGEFDHSLFPLSISLANVQMTNANKPSSWLKIQSNNA